MADYYTKAELETAQSSDILPVLQSMGYALEQEGHFYRGKLHDSIVINSVTNECHWNSKDIHGKPVELLKQILIHDYGYDVKSAYITAIKRLAGTEGRNMPPDNTISPLNRPEQKPPPKADTGNITLPEKFTNNNRVIQYLCDYRGIDREVVGELIKQGRIFETKDYHNVCFAAYDSNGVARHGFMRGSSVFADKKYQAAVAQCTTEEEKKNIKRPFKKDINNSDKSYGLIMDGKQGCNKVYCFESYIDGLSHASLYKMNGLDYQDGYRLSLHGTSFAALERFLQEHPEVEDIICCLDNDETGIRRSKKLCIEYKEKGYYPFLQLPYEKDYNTQLQQHISETEQQEQDLDDEVELEID